MQTHTITPPSARPNRKARIERIHQELAAHFTRFGSTAGEKITEEKGTARPSENLAEMLAEHNARVRVARIFRRAATTMLIIIALAVLIHCLTSLLTEH